MEQKLIVRDRECSMLRDCMESDRSEFVIVYGRRRVGKTFLIDQYFKMNYDFSFVGSHRSTQRVRLRNFKIIEVSVVRGIEKKTIKTLFCCL